MSRGSRPRNAPPTAWRASETIFEIRSVIGSSPIRMADGMSTPDHAFESRRAETFLPRIVVALSAAMIPSASAGVRGSARCRRPSLMTLTPCSQPRRPPRSACAQKLRSVRRRAVDSGQIQALARWHGVRLRVSSGRALDNLRRVAAVCRTGVPGLSAVRMAGRGFARFRCGACGLDRLVAFSCKGRGFCPSCGGRRMAERAAHLVDHVFPDVPVRQWVLGWLHRRARGDGVADGRGGAVAVIQRFGGRSIQTYTSTRLCWTASS
jgi:hypothetical protein